MTNKPHRRHTVKITIGADTMQAVAGELNHLAFLFSSEQVGEGNSVSAGGTSGSTTEHIIDPDMTHEQYFRDIDAWLEERKAEKDE